MSDLCAKKEKNASKLMDLGVVAVLKNVKRALQVYLLWLVHILHSPFPRIIFISSFLVFLFTFACFDFSHFWEQYLYILIEKACLKDSLCDTLFKYSTHLLLYSYSSFTSKDWRSITVLCWFNPVVYPVVEESWKPPRLLPGVSVSFILASSCGFSS